MVAIQCRQICVSSVNVVIIIIIIIVGMQMLFLRVMTARCTVLDLGSNAKRMTDHSGRVDELAGDRYVLTIGRSNVRQDLQIYQTICYLYFKKYNFLLTSTYDTGKMPLRLAIRPSNQLSSTRRVRLTSSPLFSDNSMADWAWKLNLARACPSTGFFGTVDRVPSFEIICEHL